MNDKEQLMEEVALVPALPDALRAYAACGWACGIEPNVFGAFVRLGVLDPNAYGQARAAELVTMLNEAEGYTVVPLGEMTA